MPNNLCVKRVVSQLVSHLYYVQMRSNTLTLIGPRQYISYFLVLFKKKLLDRKRAGLVQATLLSFFFLNPCVMAADINKKIQLADQVGSFVEKVSILNLKFEQDHHDLIQILSKQFWQESYHKLMTCENSRRPVP